MKKPPTRSYVGSYAVVEIATGKLVAELWKDSALLDKINTKKYRLVPIDKYLASLSRKENPVKKPTPAQLAARARFAEMARSGAFKKKAKKAAPKRKKNPAGVSEAKTVRELRTVRQMREWFGSMTDALTDAEVQYMKSQFITLGYGDFVPGQIPANVFYRAQIDATRLHPTVKRNPAKRKKTVSQKISQLVHEGYPQKQAVAVALSEERAGKVKRNPATGRKGSGTKLNPAAKLPKYTVQVLMSNKHNWRRVAMFDSLEQAKMYAHAIPRAYKVVAVRVVDDK